MVDVFYAVNELVILPLSVISLVKVWKDVDVGYIKTFSKKKIKYF